MTLYLVTDRNNLGLEEFFTIILQAIEGGVQMIQLREKNIPDREYIQIGSRLQSLLKPHAIPLIINDRVDIAQAINADGVHLGQSDGNISEARRVLGPKAIIGLSVETIEQALEAEKKKVDYIAASPVFPTHTKKDCSTPWGLEGLKDLCSISHHPVIAIGGINEANVKEIWESGVSGVAVISAIFHASCPKSAARRLRSYADTRLG